MSVIFYAVYMTHTLTREDPQATYAFTRVN